MVDREHARNLAVRTLGDRTSSEASRKTAREVLAMLGSPTAEERALAKSFGRVQNDGNAVSLARAYAVLKGERGVV